MPIVGFCLRRVVGDAIADLRFSDVQLRLKCPNNRYSVASLLTSPTRGAKKCAQWTQCQMSGCGFKNFGSLSNVGVQVIKFRFFVKCWGADYKISQYNIFGYQNLSVSRSIKVCVCKGLRSLCVFSNLV